MSVAFRRESDDEHKEPAFELPIAPGPNIVTPRGARLIAERIAALDAEIAAQGDEARLASLKRDLRYWHTRHATAQIAPAPPPGEVAIGARVTYRFNGETRTVAIVGGDEADPADTRIGFQAPLAQAMIGAEAGERVDFAGRAEAIEIVAAVPLEDE